jgi:hypothetical protein
MGGNIGTGGTEQMDRLIRALDQLHREKNSIITEDQELEKVANYFPCYTV